VTLFTRPCDENESNQIRNGLDELGIWIDESTNVNQVIRFK
jgi:hypothetical protein